MTRKSLFWVFLAAASLLAAWVSFHHFPDAFPLVNLEISMDRAAALEKAGVLAERFNWGPAGFEQAASFESDSTLQNFVELEGGGKPAFNRMLAGTLHAPYTWRVRHYREKEATETAVFFTPSGVPFGFREKLPEDQAGAAMAAEAARQQAESYAQTDWQVDLSAYRLVEQSEEVRPGGRVDHTVVYEHHQEDIGEGRYRLRLTVSGDRFTELTRFVKIPEGFLRRYQEMRSANSTIGTVGSTAMVMLYILGGCIVGLFFLLRSGWVLWRQAMLWGVLISLGQVLNVVNSWPLIWMSYDTALSTQAYALQQVASLMTQFLSMTLLFGLTFTAAESLTRRAFPAHIQFWRLGSSGVADSTAVLGRTLAGYLLVPLFFAYEIALYLFAQQKLGWWSPSNSLFEPDILATYWPWVSSLVNSLQAGFWEECLFRAVPMAGAVLLGRRFGHGKLWLLLAFIVQALIFGAGHAPYANQPTYARVVELILPSLFFAGLYYHFGLLPAIVLHFAFDVVWMALPLFVASAPGIWVDQSLVVLLTLSPLVWVLLRRWRAGRWTEIAESDRNAAWSPPLPTAATTATPEVQEGVWERPFLDRRLVQILVLAALAALGLWAGLGTFESDAPRLKVRRLEALELAREELFQRDVEVPPPWKELTSLEGMMGLAHEFIWRTAGEATYREILGTYLEVPGWRVRFARFEGSVEERAEEYLVELDGLGAMRRYFHQLPEARPGASLELEEAREMAHEEVRNRFGLDTDRLKEISAQPRQRTARRDWLFTFSDQTIALPQGETRIFVRIGGDELIDSSRGVHIPERWLREEQNRQVVRRIFLVLRSLVLVGLALTGGIMAVVSWSRRRFSVTAFLRLSSLIFSLTLLGVVNQWLATWAQFSTAQPVSNQVVRIVGTRFVAFLFLALLVGLLGGLAHRWQKKADSDRKHERLLAGLALGIVATVLGSLLELFWEPVVPLWASYSPTQAFLPILDPALGALARYLGITAALLLIFTAVDRFSQGWQRRRIPASAGLIGLGLVAQTMGSEPLSQWMISGLALGIVFWAVYRFAVRIDLALLPLATASASALSLLQEGSYRTYPLSVAAATLATASVLTAGLLWWRALSRPVHGSPQPGASFGNSGAGDTLSTSESPATQDQ